MLYTGSGGNSAYIGVGTRGILIDAGVSAKRIDQALIDVGTQLSNIDGIFITHEHIDHVRGLEVLSRKGKIPIYINEPTLRGAEQHGFTFNRELIHIMDTGDTVTVCDMRITSFATMHDTEASVGFRVETADNRTIGYATDLGTVSEEVCKNLDGCDTVVLESNHDIEMLKNGIYPYPLKIRILSEMGHLSNLDSAREIARLGKAGTTRFILAHLSQENNRPSIAYAEALNALEAEGLRRGYDFELECAPVASGELHVF